MIWHCYVITCVPSLTCKKSFPSRVREPSHENYGKPTYARSVFRWVWSHVLRVNIVQRMCAYKR